ncbi:MAG: flagellar basal body rod protein FlgB [Burkholderiaceae bacterium]
MSRLTDSIDFHGRALLLRAERQKVISGNIANADTPGYAARDFDFRAALADATRNQSEVRSATGQSGQAAGRDVAGGLQVTQAGHLGQPATEGARIDSTVLRFRNVEQASIDGNSVDLDRERAAFADNAVRFEASLRFINGSVRTMLSAIRGE